MTGCSAPGVVEDVVEDVWDDHQRCTCERERGEAKHESKNQFYVGLLISLRGITLSMFCGYLECCRTHPIGGVDVPASDPLLCPSPGVETDQISLLGGPLVGLQKAPRRLW